MGVVVVVAVVVVVGVTQSRNRAVPMRCRLRPPPPFPARGRCVGKNRRHGIDRGGAVLAWIVAPWHAVRPAPGAGPVRCLCDSTHPLS